MTSMEAGVEEIKLAGSLDIDELLKYQGNGKCKRIHIFGFDHDVNENQRKEVLAWCKQWNWSAENKEGDTRQMGECYGLELKRE